MNAVNNDTSILPSLPPRRPDSHKGDFGRALLIGGSRGMAGAIGLAGMAALRGGAGLVRLAVPESELPTVASFEPSYMTFPLPADDQGRIAASAEKMLPQLLESATAVACGPGLGRSAALSHLVDRIYASVRQPLVLDADALNALDEKSKKNLNAKHILTPHSREFKKVFDVDATSQAAKQTAMRYGCTIVLKGNPSFCQ